MQISLSKSQWYDLRFLKYRANHTEIGNFKSFFALLPLLITRKMKISKNEKKTTGDIIILQKCTKNHDHMVYCPWDMAWDGCNYFSFWAIFGLFTPLTAQKIKISKKWKTCLEISAFYTCTKIMIRWWTVPEI